eukprot:1287092-Pyramimonas_sp.AAC.1
MSPVHCLPFLRFPLSFASSSWGTGFVRSRLGRPQAWRRTQPYAVVGIAFGGAHYGPRYAVLCGGDACGHRH